MKVAILDDYQNVAFKTADWSAVASRAEINVFNDHIADPAALVERLLPFDVVCVMRERTPLPREIIQRLPNLKLIASTGPRNASIDVAAAQERGIKVTGSGYRSTPTVELTWALILASARHVVQENNAVRHGGWQTALGQELDGKVLGVLGLGNIGKQVARIGLAFGMKVIAWSQNMTRETAEAEGATLVSKSELFRQADIVTVHLILSKRTRGLVGAAELQLMKPTARLVNTSARPDRRRRRADQSFAVANHSGSRDRRVRRGAVAGTASPSASGQRFGDTAHRIRLRRAVSDFLRGCSGKHRRVAQRSTNISKGVTRCLRSLPFVWLVRCAPPLP